jgi:protein phosphatase
MSAAGDLPIPESALVCLIGPSGSGKSTFASRRFSSTEVVSSDFYRAMVSDDANDQEASKPAFRIVHLIVRERLRRGKLTVVDATNVARRSRAPLVAAARTHGRPTVAIVFALPLAVCFERNRGRGDRIVDEDVLRGQWVSVHRTMSQLPDEGFDLIHVVES